MTFCYHQAVNGQTAVDQLQRTHINFYYVHSLYLEDHLRYSIGILHNVLILISVINLFFVLLVSSLVAPFRIATITLIKMARKCLLKKTWDYFEHNLDTEVNIINKNLISTYLFSGQVH